MILEIHQFSQCKVLVVGDLMLDEYLWGNVERISPEAPVQVVDVQKESYTLGGAGNVANNLAALGAEVSVAGVIGEFSDGEKILGLFHDFGADTSAVVREPGRYTTRKTRIIAANQHVLRIDRETRKNIPEQVQNQILNVISEKIGDMDIVLVSDYGKGLVTRPLLSKIVSLCRQNEKTVIADPKGTDYTKYDGVDLITPNKKEAALASGIEIDSEADLFEAGRKILETVDLKRLLITCGNEGMVLFERNHAPHRIRAQARQVFDVSGAGDTVVAVLGLALARGASFQDAASVANTAAGIVVGKLGTATVSPQELTAALTPPLGEISAKLKTLSELEAVIARRRKNQERIVLTNGCFDLLHAGHINLFAQSKRLGDVLIVAIDDDPSVKKLKGTGRPVIKEKNRARILCALDDIDYVLIFCSERLSEILETLRPDFLTKGSNYNTDQVRGKELVEKHGGKVVLIPISENISSTAIIDSIKNSKIRRGA